jgi:hypothetical protein
MRAGMGRIEAARSLRSAASNPRGITPAGLCHGLHSWVGVPQERDWRGNLYTLESDRLTNAAAVMRLAELVDPVGEMEESTEGDGSGCGRCSECHGFLDGSEHYCPNCGVRLA